MIATKSFIDTLESLMTFWMWWWLMYAVQGCRGAGVQGEAVQRCNEFATIVCISHAEIHQAHW
jgi:hypothetical protein